MVFYRKYRPQQIDDLDNAHLRETLYRLLQKQTVHAFLFTGPKGLGKTSTARIIAKAVNCTGRAKNQEQKSKKLLSSESLVQSAAGVEPCNQCEQCLSITNGTNMDILEIDAASNRGIDEIRDLKEKIRLAPLTAKKKVYIIDEVHMLTTEAFNALLKTLEEPPEHAMFILCTTEPHKVPATILSRCFHVSFQSAGQDELIRSFKRIVKGEGITIDDDALALIAHLAEGGFRDGAKVLEEIASLAGGQKITKAFVEEHYHVSSIQAQIQDMLASLHQKDAKAGISLISDLKKQGVDMKYFIQQLMEALHDMLLVHAGVKRGEDSTYQVVSMNELRALFVLLSRASSEMKFSVLPQLPLELAVIEWCVEGQKDAEVSAELRETAGEEEGEVTVSKMRKQVGEITRKKVLYGETDEAPKPKREQAQADVELLHTMPEGDVAPEWLAALWKGIIAETKQHNHTIAGVLRGCRIKTFDRKALVIETAYPFHKERLDDMKTKAVLTKICKTLTGKDIAVKVELR